VRQLGSHSLSLSWPTVARVVLSPWILSALLLGLASFCIYAYLLSRVEMTLVAPLVNAVFYLVVFAVAATVFRENVTPGRVVGVGLLLAGMCLLARDGL
jgi:drug/metabolite transporter (DMT)-like permease